MPLVPVLVAAALGCLRFQRCSLYRLGCSLRLPFESASVAGTGPSFPLLLTLLGPTGCGILIGSLVPFAAALRTRLCFLVIGN